MGRLAAQLAPSLSEASAGQAGGHGRSSAWESDMGSEPQSVGVSVNVNPMRTYWKNTKPQDGNSSSACTSLGQGHVLS